MRACLLRVAIAIITIVSGLAPGAAAAADEAPAPAIVPATPKLLFDQEPLRLPALSRNSRRGQVVDTGLTAARLTIEFKARQLAILATADHHFGLILTGAQKKRLQLLIRDNAIYLLPAGGKAKVLGRLREPLSAGADSPWTRFSLTLNGSFGEVNANGTLVGSFDEAFGPVAEVELYSVKGDVEISALKLETSPPAGSGAAAR